MPGNVNFPTFLGQPNGTNWRTLPIKEALFLLFCKKEVELLLLDTLDVIKLNLKLFKI